MIVLSLIALFVYLFGAYAYGYATLICVTQASPVWGPSRTYADGVRARINQVSFALFAISTAWFIINGLIEFRILLGIPGRWLDLGVFIVYLFPPVIMHTVYLETQSQDQVPPPAIYRQLLKLMYGLSPLVGMSFLAAIYGWLPRPEEIGAWIGISIGSLFTLSSLYCTTLMLNRPHPSSLPGRRPLRNVMIFLFIALSGVFIALIFMQQERLLVQALDRVARSSPIFFLMASIYFENRFEFFDLVVKRALLLLLSLVTLGLYFALVLPWLEQVQSGSARPWLYAVALVPMAMLLQGLYVRADRWLDRMWLGREFTLADASRHLLGALQLATDEDDLRRNTEIRLSEIFHAPVVVRLDDEPLGGSTEAAQEVSVPSIGGARIRMIAVREPGARPLLSEDLARLRTLAGMFGFMLENTRLQKRRQEQDQLTQDLRLQTSKSELKALRAQINPHFLFNALNAIASLIHTDPARADEAVEQLAEVFRYTLRRSESEWAPLDQELAFARAYLDVEQARFGQRLTCTIDSDHLPPPPQVPAMLLQTLIENAVKHGVSQQRDPGRIDVVVRTTSSEITVEVRDTGPGADSRGLQPRDGEGFGLRSVRERLHGYFGERASLSLTRDEAAGVTIARVVMPVVRMAA